MPVTKLKLVPAPRSPNPASCVKETERQRGNHSLAAKCLLYGLSQASLSTGWIHRTHGRAPASPGTSPAAAAGLLRDVAEAVTALPFPCGEGLVCGPASGAACRLPSEDHQISAAPRAPPCRASPTMDTVKKPSLPHYDPGVTARCVSASQFSPGTQGGLPRCPVPVSCVRKVE